MGGISAFLAAAQESPLQRRRPRRRPEVEPAEPLTTASSRRSGASGRRLVREGDFPEIRGSRRGGRRLIAAVFPPNTCWTATACSVGSSSPTSFGFAQVIPGPESGLTAERIESIRAPVVPPLGGGVSPESRQPSLSDDPVEWLWNGHHIVRREVAPGSWSCMRILIAEDDDHPARPPQVARRKPGDVCAEARDGVEAVELVEEHDPDLAILDVKMPRLDGIEAAKRILEERPIPIVMLTAYGQDELVARAVEAGVFGYLVEPLREADLLPAIATAERGTRSSRRSAKRPTRWPGARRAQGDRTGQGIADGTGGAKRGGGVRPPAQGESALRQAAQGRRRRADRDAGRLGLLEQRSPGVRAAAGARRGRLGAPSAARRCPNPRRGAVRARRRPPPAGDLRFDALERGRAAGLGAGAFASLLHLRRQLGHGALALLRRRTSSAQPPSYERSDSVLDRERPLCDARAGRAVVRDEQHVPGNASAA